MLSNSKLVLMTYLTLINNSMQKYKQFKKNNLLLKANKDIKTYIKTKYKFYANFLITKLYSENSQRTILKRKKNFFDIGKIKKYYYKYLAQKICNQINKESNKCLQIKHLNGLCNSFIDMKKSQKFLKTRIISSLSFTKNLNYVTKIIDSKKIKIFIIYKFIVNLATMKYLITNHNLIYNC